MREMICSLCLLFCVLFWHEKTRVAVSFGWAVIWCVLFSLALKTLIPYDLQTEYTTAVIVCALVFLQDLKDGFFRLLWLGAAFVLPFCTQFLMLSLPVRLAGCFFALPALYFARKGWMGSADPIALAAAGFSLGFERMQICVLIACLTGLFCAGFSEERKLPFLSYLSAGFMIALLRGLTILEMLRPWG